MSQTEVLSKAGPRLINFYRDAEHLSIVVNGPGMLFEKLELMTNRSALEGATVAFWHEVARGLVATVDCPHEPIRRAEVSVETHRLGGELTIEIGASSMYQSELRIRTTTGQTFRGLIDGALSAQVAELEEGDPTIAVLVAHRAAGHQEHHSSAKALLRRAAKAHVHAEGGA